MIKKIIITLILCISMIWALTACQYYDNSTKNIPYPDMPVEIRDSIEAIISHHKIDEIPLLICFNGDFSMKNKKIGPWVLCRIITNNRNNEEIKLPTSSSTPIIVDESYIYIPSQDNILIAGIPEKLYFKRIPIRK